MTSCSEPVLVAFDFDGTITRGESFFRFLWFITPPVSFVLSFLRALPWMLAHVSGLMRNDRAKERVITAFLRGRSQADVEARAVDFARQVIPLTLRRQALAALRDHQRQGHTCALVSATLALYLRPWAAQQGFDQVLATELVTVLVQGEAIFTGEMATPNCYGPEKVRRLQAAYPNVPLKAAYGDSRGDRELLACAERGQYRPWND